MTEQNLIQSAEAGDVSAMLKLAKYYEEHESGNRVGDKVGDVISIEDFNKMMEDEDDDKSKDEFKALAYKYYRMAAEAGDAKAMTETARRLYDGIGVEKNEAESDTWYKRGAEAGEPSAMRVVAFRSDDDAEKFKYFKLSAELLEPGLNKDDSIKQTAIYYATGKGTPKDLDKAEEWLAKLDKRDANSAMIEISQITGDNSWLKRAAGSSTTAMIQMAESFVLKKDFVNALSWYEKAGAKGSHEAMSLAGDIYYIGEDGIEQSYEKAFKCYSRAAARGYNMAKIKMTLMLYRGLGVEQDMPRAFKNFSEISWTRENFGPFSPFRFNSVARYYAAKMRENGEGCIADPVDALERYKVAGALERIQPYESARSISRAVYKVADAYFLGKGTKQNFGKALKFYEKVVTEGDSDTPYHREAIKKIIWMYELGEGVPQDKEKAAEWRKKLGDND